MPALSPPAVGARRVLMADLSAPESGLDAELCAALTRVAQAGRFILGPEVEAFEQQLAAEVGAAHAVALGSGSDALVIALRCAGVEPGDVVVTSALSFVATAEAVVRCGASPRWLDVDPERLTLCPSAVERYLQSCQQGAEGFRDPWTGGRVRALLPVHLYGRVADVTALARLAGEQLALVHDAAQAVGARAADGAPLSAGGSVCLSFFPSKNLGAWGDGGALLCDDAAIAARARRLRQHGRDDSGAFVEPGYNSRLDALQAVVLRHKLASLAQQQQRRRLLVRHYHQAFAAAAIDAELRQPPALRPGDIAHLYTVEVLAGAELRAALQQALAAEGIESRVYYPRPLHSEPAFAPYLHGTPLNHAERASEQVLSLPLHPRLSEADVERVVAVVRRFFSAGR